MEPLIAIVIFFGVWFFVARSFKNKGRGFFLRHIAAFAAAFVCLGIFAVSVGPTKKADQSAVVAATDASASTTSNSAQPTASTQKEPVAPRPAKLPTVTSSKLFSDYDENEVAADQIYKGRAFVVTGTVQSIDKDVFNNIVIVLKTSNQFMGTHARLDDKNEQLAASLHKGQKVSFACTGGGRVIGSPMLTDCSPA